MRLLTWLPIFSCVIALGIPVAGQRREPCGGKPSSLLLPVGFCSSVFADGVGSARDIAVSAAGDVYVLLWAYREKPTPGSVVALRDVNQDGRADEETRFGLRGGDVLEWRNSHLYASTADSIIRYRLPSGQLSPVEPPETVVSDLPVFPEQPEHGSKTFAFTERSLLVHVGAPTNACQESNRRVGSPGLNPCPFLERTGGVWEFALTENLKFSQGARLATGVRHTRGMVALGPERVLAVVHGRDLLHENWPDRFSESQSAVLPSDELVVLRKGGDLGWPYCYFDPIAGRRVLAPEYGGDGKMVGQCLKYEAPVFSLPAHSAPNDLLVHSGRGLPSRFKGGAFIAFHGGWGRTPFAQVGFEVGFLPLADATAAGDLEVFAGGFSGHSQVQSPRHADYQPVGLVEGPDGSLFVVDSRKGRVWKIWFDGQ